MAIIRKEAYFNSSTGKNKIHCMIWQDDAVKPIALFQIAHGMSEHIERYDDFACFLAGHGFIVCGNDHLGHGKSVNSLDDLGYMDDKTAISAWLMICISCITSCTTRYPDLPYFLFGHSMVPSFPAPTPHTSARSCRCNLLWYGRASRLPGGCVSAFDKV